MYIKNSISLSLMLLLFVMVSSATAGGISWVFQVNDFQETKNAEAVIVLKPLETGEEFPLNCTTLTIYAQYSAWRWFFVSDTSISKANHRKALLLLKESFVAQAPVVFGSMGEGFGFESGKYSCVVSSRALSVIEVNGRREIYSYFKWP